MATETSPGREAGAGVPSEEDAAATLPVIIDVGAIGFNGFVGNSLIDKKLRHHAGSNSPGKVMGS